MEPVQSHHFAIMFPISYYKMKYIHCFEFETRVYQSLPFAAYIKTKTRNKKHKNNLWVEKNICDINIDTDIYIRIPKTSPNQSVRVLPSWQPWLKGPAPDESPPQPPLQSRGSPTACPTRRSDKGSVKKHAKVFVKVKRRESIMSLQKKQHIFVDPNRSAWTPQKPSQKWLKY